MYNMHFQVAVPKKKKKGVVVQKICIHMDRSSDLYFRLFAIFNRSDKVLLLYKKSYTIVLVAAFWCSCAKDKFKYVCLNTLPAELVRGRPKPHTLLYTLCKRVIIVTIWVYTYLPKKKKERWGWGDYRLHGKANTLCNAWKWTCRV